MKKLLLLLLLLSGWQSIYSQDKRPYVVLVSFDAFRADYVERFNLPNFKSFINKGAAAEYMLPCFPSKTFPNHYSIVTGLQPGHHGLVDNQFYDSATAKDYNSHSVDARDARFYGGKPLWRVAREQGMKSASFFWVGSEMNDTSLNPDYFFNYNDSISFETRIIQVIDWLKLPEKERPHFITLYFYSPDHESHTYGPWAPETRQVILRMDSLLGVLMKGIESTKLPVNTILVSDHGMSEVKVVSESYIFLDELMDLKNPAVRVVNGGTQAHIYLKKKSQTDSLYNLLKGKEKDFKVYRQSDFPDVWQYKHPRSGDILLVVAHNHYIRKADRAGNLKTAKLGSMRGEHGFDPNTTPDMRAIFYAQGPNIRPGKKIPPFQNIDIFPLITRILGLTSPAIDGNPKTLEGIYRR